MAKIDEVIDSLSPAEIELLNSDPELLAAFKAKYMVPEAAPNMHSEMLSGQDVRDLWNAAGQISKGAAAVMTGAGQTIGTGAAAAYNALKGNPVDIAGPMADTGNQMVKIAAGDERAPGGASTFTDLLDPRYAILGEILGPLLGKALSLFATKGADAIGTVISWLSPGQQPALMAFLRANPEFLTWVKTLAAKSGRAMVAGAEEAPGVVAGATQDLTAATKKAMDVFKLSPEAFMEKLKDVAAANGEAKGLGDLATIDRGYVLAAKSLLDRAGSKTVLTRLGVAGLVGFLSHFIPGVGPLLSVGATLGEFALGSPAVATAVQSGLGRSAELASSLGASPAMKAVPSTFHAIKESLGD